MEKTVNERQIKNIKREINISINKIKEKRKQVLKKKIRNKLM